MQRNFLGDTHLGSQITSGNRDQTGVGEVRVCLGLQYASKALLPTSKSTVVCFQLPRDTHMQHSSVSPDAMLACSTED